MKNRLIRLIHRAPAVHAFTAIVGVLVSTWAPTTLTPPMLPMTAETETAQPLASVGAAHSAFTPAGSAPLIFADLRKDALAQDARSFSPGSCLQPDAVTQALAPTSRPASVNPPAGNWLHPADTTDAPVRGYDPPQTRYGAGHRGVDFSAPAGRIVAPANGVVSFVGVVVNRKVLTIDHGGGYKSSFEPIDTDLTRHERVQAGDFLGTVGEYTDEGAHCPGSCFHWGVRLDGEYVNPVPLLRLFKPSVLLPMFGAD